MKNFSHKIKYRKTGSVKTLCCLFAFILVVLCLCMPINVKAEGHVIKVGYIEQGDFIHENNGVYTGYGVEYLDEVADITGWEYKFILDTWENCLEKLENGEIDLVCSAQYTEDRAEKFLYTNLPLGYEYTLLYADAESDIYYNDYEAMDGLMVGMMSGSYHTTAFEKIVEERNLDLKFSYFATDFPLS